MRIFRRLIHKAAHSLGWNMGAVTTWTGAEGVFVGFQCSGCGKLQHAVCIEKVIDRHIERNSKAVRMLEMIR